MAEEITPQELAEALVCIAKLILLVRRLGWVDDEGFLLELEDAVSELHQEAQ